MSYTVACTSNSDYSRRTVITIKAIARLQATKETSEPVVIVTSSQAKAGAKRALRLLSAEAEKLQGTKYEKLWSNLAADPLQSSQKELMDLMNHFNTTGNKKAAPAARTAIGFM